MEHKIIYGAAEEVEMELNTLIKKNGSDKVVVLNMSVSGAMVYVMLQLYK